MLLDEWFPRDSQTERETLISLGQSLLNKRLHHITVFTANLVVLSRGRGAHSTTTLLGEKARAVIAALDSGVRPSGYGRNGVIVIRKTAQAA
jgi:hypothetical protein